MRQIIWLPLLIMMAVLPSCGNKHLIEDSSVRKAINSDYRKRSEAYPACELFRAADTLSENDRREAVKFLLAYMPLSDLAVYEPGFLIANADAALRTRREMPWGARVPYDLFVHFVLPPRINNENPDSFRLCYYDELRERVKGMNDISAALEINRWCHEKVTYQPSDSRTSSPMATILSARGRCGEESTLTVAALRTIGLPARQVYTPRWAHTDDNHAWVEFWSNGEWHYMGACEPETVPDRGWFTEPARRAMLIHTKAYGRYIGDEPLVRREKLFSEINTLARYARTKELTITVTDSAGNPVPEAEASYLLYNYAELYPLVRLRCDTGGQSKLTTGKGSLVIWANDGKRYGFAVAAPSDTSLVVKISSRHPEGITELDLSPPPVLPPFPGIDETLVAENNARLKAEDSIRLAYVQGWMKDISTDDIARNTGISKERIEKLLQKSMGNYRSITSFVSASGEKAGTAVRILENISDKDLRDTPASVLFDHLVNEPINSSGIEQTLFDKYVISPRIDNELLTPFRSYFKKVYADLMPLFEKDPSFIAEWIDTAINITTTDNYYGTPVVPAGVSKLRTADRHSRDIFFVALCRTAGHPARLDPGTGRPQYLNQGRWQDVWFTGEHKPESEAGRVAFVSGETNPAPEYHIHFTLSVLDKGSYNTLDFGYGVKISDLPAEIPVWPGRYMLTTGNRDTDGNVLASLEFIVINAGEKADIDIRLRHHPKTASAGKVSFERELAAYDGGKINLKELSEKGIVFMWIEPGKEPTRHLMNDLPQLRSEFDKWGGYFVFLTDPARTPTGYNPADFDGLPSNTVFVSDADLEFMRLLLPGSPSEHPLPVVLSCNSEGNILYLSEGYRIGTGEQILRNIR